MVIVAAGAMRMEIGLGDTRPGGIASRSSAARQRIATVPITGGPLRWMLVGMRQAHRRSDR
jgi:hypothetical protein